MAKGGEPIKWEGAPFCIPLISGLRKDKKVSYNTCAMGSSGLEKELFQIEYPYLTETGDPDIERYYELRSLGRDQDALILYRTKLVPRYPEEAFRMELLRAYRTHSPDYPRLLQRAYEKIGERLIDKVKTLIEYIAQKARSYDPTDVYSTIKTAEAILALLPKERYEAILSMERLLRYAERLRFHVTAIQKAEALIRAYLTESLQVVEEERSRRQAALRHQQEEARRRLVEQDKAELARLRSQQRELSEPIRGKKTGPEKTAAPRRTVVLDLSRVHFSPYDLARIQIPPTLTRVEDKTLAYCFKYWNLVNDAAFERVLFLYSRKYGTKHYEVFSIIQRGRRTGKRDDEILAAVMGALISGYYYSIRGDIYLQQQWAILKKKLEGKGVESPSVGQKEMAPHPAVPRRPPLSSRRVGSSAGSRGRPASVQGEVAPRTTGAPEASRNASTSLHGKDSIQSPRARVAVLSKSIPSQRKTGSPSTRRVPKKQEAVSMSPVPPGAGGTMSGGSVSDRLKRLSGKAYDVYGDLFFMQVRPAIRQVLSKGKGLFFTVPESVEDAIYEFLKENYHNPFMNWEESDTRGALRQEGFDVPSLDPIIEACYRRMQR